jgi:hypothetical protein
MSVRLRHTVAVRQSITCVAVAAVTALLIAACSAGSPDGARTNAATPESAAAISGIIRALSEAGIDCTGLEPRTAATHVKEQGKCKVGGEDVLIRAFDTSADRDLFLQSSDKVVDQLSFNIDSPPRLIGPTWIVTTDTAATARLIQAALGGELK